MNRGMLFSLLLHGALLLLLIFGLPDFFFPPPPHETAMSVELLPMSEMSNVKKRTIKQKPKPIDKPKPVTPPPPPPSIPDPVLEKLEPKPEPKPKPKPEPKKPEAIKPKPTEQKKQDKPKDKPKKKEKKKTAELDSLLKDLSEQAAPDKPTEENDKSDSTSYNDAAPLSMNEQDAIRSQVESHWSPPAGAKDAGKLQVVIRVTLDADGTVNTVEIEKHSKGSDPAVSRAFDESCMRAVKMASPFQHLPTDKYDSWKEFTFTFTPEGIS